MDFLDAIKDSFGKMSGILTFLLLITVVLSYFFKGGITKYLKARADAQNRIKECKENQDIKSLIYHRMFLTADKVLTKIDTIDFTTFDEHDAVKTILLRRLIELKIKTVKHRFTEFLNQEGLDNVDASQLKFRVAGMLSTLVNEYNQEAHAIMCNEFGIKKKDAKYLIDSYEKFRQYIVEAFTDELESIVMDDNYTNNFERLNTILYTVSISLHIIPRDVVVTFNEVNGRFKKYSLG